MIYQKRQSKKAASAYPNSASWFVSSMKYLPFTNRSVDGVPSVFAPIESEETARILKKNGFLLTVTPARDHLIEFGQQLFDQIREIDNFKIEDKLEKDFILLKHIPISYEIQLEQNDINNLLTMTPYYWKSPPERQKALLSLPQMIMTINMVLCLFQKKLS